MLDRMEPFRPVAVGYHVFYESGPSPSFPRVVELGEPAPARCQAVIEYAFWWDWDIQHLYELEHAWVYVGERSEEHTSELQSRENLVCRLLLEKKKERAD